MSEYESMSDVAPKAKCSLKLVGRKISPPKLVLIYAPLQPVKNGKNRRKFPSPVKDYYIKVKVVPCVSETGSQENWVPIYYEYDGHDALGCNNSLVNGPVYLLGISSITRHCTNQELLDLPIHQVCQYHPLNYCTGKDIPSNHYGFWFRFFGKSCRFHIIITLKLHRHGKDDKVVNTIEVDVTNIETFPIKKHISVKTTNFKSHDCSLYLEKEYINVMEILYRLQEQCMWEKCIAVGNEILSSLESNGKSDIKACILLEQSKSFSHLGKFAIAKSLVKQTLEIIPANNQNKDLLVARAYIYLSLSHHYDLSLGNAEECLSIARQKLIKFKHCEDTADLHYNEGLLLISFLLKFPNLNKRLMAEVNEKLEKAIKHYQETYNSSHARIMNKIYNTQLCMTILLLFTNPENYSLSSVEKMISSFGNASLFKETECRIMLVKALVLQYQASDEAAITNAKHALDIANKFGLYVEIQLIVKCLKSLKCM